MIFGVHPEGIPEPTKVKDPPVFVQKNKVEPKQYHKVNTIIQSMYDDFNTKANSAYKNTANYTYRASSFTSQLVDKVKDISYNEFVAMSFDFYTSGFVEDDIIPVMKLNKAVVGEVIFFGVDDMDNPTSFLGSYGRFIPTYYEYEDEYQLSFYCYNDCPDRKWKVSLSFITEW